MPSATKLLQQCMYTMSSVSPNPTNQIHLFLYSVKRPKVFAMAMENKPVFFTNATAVLVATDRKCFVDTAVGCSVW